MEESSLRRIEKFKQSLDKLKKLSKYPEKRFFEDPMLGSALERNIQVSVEAIMDVSRKIISFMEWDIPKTYKETIDLLREKRVIQNRLAESLKDLVGLRNILVHLYADVRLDTVLDGLEDSITTLDSAMKKLLEFCEDKKIDP